MYIMDGCISNNSKQYASFCDRWAECDCKAHRFSSSLHYPSKSSLWLFFFFINVHLPARAPSSFSTTSGPLWFPVLWGFNPANSLTLGSLCFCTVSYRCSLKVFPISSPQPHSFGKPHLLCTATPHGQLEGLFWSGVLGRCYFSFTPQTRATVGLMKDTVLQVRGSGGTKSQKEARFQEHWQASIHRTYDYWFPYWFLNPL